MAALDGYVVVTLLPAMLSDLSLPIDRIEVVSNGLRIGAGVTLASLLENPAVAGQKGWTLDKSGEPVSPFDVVESGNRHMHALNSGFNYTEGAHEFAVQTLDAPVVALGERTPLLFINDQPDLGQGIHSCLYNNAWGTNYIMWFGENMTFRFLLRA